MDSVKNQKNEEKGEKDPIKDKYLQKVGFFKKIQMKLFDFRQKCKSSKSFKEDASAVGELVGKFLLYGFLGASSLMLVNIDFSLSTFIGCGAFLWLLENNITDIVVRILGSFKLVNIYK